MTQALQERVRAAAFVVSSEFAERVSYYGIQAILVVFMTSGLKDATGAPAPMTDADALMYYHLFVSASMFLPILGGLLSDTLLGKYTTILWLSVLYSVGHAALAFDETRIGLAIGLVLIALGSGGIKACVPALLGDQFTDAESHARRHIYFLYFWALNLASLISTLVTPWLLERVGPAMAFGMPCVLMIASTLVFYTGRRRYRHVPPVGWRHARSVLSLASMRELRPLIALFAVLVPPIGIIYVMNSGMVLQAESMDRRWCGIDWLPAQIFVFNPLFCLIQLPLFSRVIYPWLERRIRLTPFHKMGAGCTLMVLGFLMLAWLQWRIEAGAHPSIGWQVLVLAVFVGVEMLLHVTTLEFAYAEAPERLKSLAVSLRFVAISLGNGVLVVATWIASRLGANPGAPSSGYYLALSAVLVGCLLLFIAVAYRYPTATPQPAPI